MRIRFIERDYWINKICKNSTYITDDQIESMLPEANYVDLTFIFTELSSGYKTDIYDNKSNKYISVDDLNIAANTFYIGQVYKLSLQKMAKCKADDKAEKCISIIKSMINGWKDEAAIV